MQKSGQYNLLNEILSKLSYYTRNRRLLETSSLQTLLIGAAMYTKQLVKVMEGRKSKNIYRNFIIPSLSKLFLPSHNLLYYHLWHQSSSLSLDLRISKRLRRRVLKYRRICHQAKSISIEMMGKDKDKI